MADTAFERDFSIRLHAELEQVSGPRPQWSGGEKSMDGSDQARRSRWPLWLGAAAIVVIASAALVITQQRAATAGAVASPSPSPALTAHEVATDQGVVSFAIGDGAIVVRLKAGATTTELGRSTSANATSGFAMVCGPADGLASHRYVFGNLGIGAPIIYQGPPADGQGAPDGTFLFALRPGTIGTTGTIQSQPGHPALMVQVELGSGPGHNLVGFPGGVWADAVATGQRQSSGCFVLN